MTQGLRESGGAFVLMARFHRNVWVETAAFQDPASTRKPFRNPATQFPNRDVNAIMGVALPRTDR